MKIPVTIFIFIALNLNTLAQTPHSISLKDRTENFSIISDHSKVKKTYHLTPESNIVYWKETFAGGITSWTNTGYDGALNLNDSVKWEFRGPITFPNSAIGSRGAWVGTRGAIASPSSADGFIIFDSDYLDNRGNGSLPGLGPAPSPHVGTLTSPTIDLSSSTGIVRIQFYHYMRTFYGQTWVAFSHDGGLSYPDSILLSLPDINNETDNAVLEKINLPPTYTGKRAVKIKFIFDGRLGNANGNGYYFAQIDDIEILDAPDNDLIFGGFQTTNVIGASNYVNAENRGIDLLDSQSGDRYGRVPSRQRRDINFDAQISNFGNLDQADTRLEVNISNSANTQIYKNNSAPSILTSGTSKIDTVHPYWSPDPTADVYSIVWTASATGSDSSPQDNTDTMDVEITEATFGPALYSVDFVRDWNEAELSFLGTNSFTGANNNFRMATRYSIPVIDEIDSVYIRLSAQSRVGGIMKVIVFDTLGSGSGDVAALANFHNVEIRYMESDYYVLTAADTAAREVTIPIPTTLQGFPQSRTLPVGAYYVSVELQSGSGTNIIRIPSDESFPQDTWTSLIYIDAMRWYTNGNAFAIRPMLKGGVTSLEELNEFGFSVSQNQPNPFNLSTRVDVRTNFGGDLELNVTNTLGQVVYMKALSGANAGQHTFNVDASSLQSGVYMYTISLNGKSVTKRMIVK